jgi:MFS transporter, DHA1 family, tetracycline resistance protein
VSTHGHGRAALGFILVTVVLDVLSIGIIVPVLPKLVEDFLEGDTVRAAEVFGLFGTAWAVMQFVSAPILGALSDRFGRRPVLLLSMAGLGLDYVLMALAPTLAWLFVGRLVSGITAASFSTANAYISDVTPPERRGAAFGAVGAAFGLGFVLGPAVGGLLGQSDPRLPFWVAAGFSLTNALYGLMVLPESLPPERRTPFSWARANPLGSLLLLGSSRALGGLAATHLLAMVGQNVYPAIFVLYAGYRYGWDAGTVGLALAAVGVASIVVQGGLVRPVLARLGDRRAMLLGLTFSALGYLAGADRRVVRRDDPGGRSRRLLLPRRPGADDPPRGPGPARPAPGRPVRAGEHRLAGVARAVHPDVRPGDRRLARLPRPGGALLWGGGAGGRGHAGGQGQHPAISERRRSVRSVSLRRWWCRLPARGC